MTETRKKKLHFLLSEYNAQDKFVEDIHAALLQMANNATATDALLCEFESYVEERTKIKYQLKQWGFTNTDEILLAVYKMQKAESKQI